MANKKTVVEMFTEIMNVPGLTQEQKDFLARRIELTNKKNANGANKPTKTQLENEDVKTEILKVLACMAKPSTIKEIQYYSAPLEKLSNQKISALLTQLVKAKKVERTEVKGKAHFALPSED